MTIKCSTHRLYRAKLGDSIIYRCSKGGCNSFFQRDLVKGRIVECNRCGNPFEITSRTLKACPAKPHCEHCFKNSKTKPEIEVDKKIDELLDKIII